MYEDFMLDALFTGSGVPGGTKLALLVFSLKTADLAALESSDDGVPVKSNPVNVIADAINPYVRIPVAINAAAIWPIV